MWDDLLGTTNYLQKGLDASWQRNEAINNNIANVDTPNFKGSDVNFQQVFAQALSDAENGMNIRKTRTKHFDIGKTNVEDVEGYLYKRDETTMREDGNNIDIDVEMNELAKNSLYYYSIVNKVNSGLGRLRSAIREGK